MNMLIPLIILRLQDKLAQWVWQPISSYLLTNTSRSAYGLVRLVAISQLTVGQQLHMVLPPWTWNTLIKLNY